MMDEEYNNKLVNNIIQRSNLFLKTYFNIEKEEGYDTKNNHR